MATIRTTRLQRRNDPVNFRSSLSVQAIDDAHEPCTVCARGPAPLLKGLTPGRRTAWNESTVRPVTVWRLVGGRREWIRAPERRSDRAVQLAEPHRLGHVREGAHLHGLRLQRGVGAARDHDDADRRVERPNALEHLDAVE